MYKVSLLLKNTLAKQMHDKRNSDSRLEKKKDEDKTCLYLHLSAGAGPPFRAE